MADAPHFPPSRALVLNVMLSLLASAAVFVIVSWLVLVPQLARHEAELRTLRAEVEELRGALTEQEMAPPAEAARPAAAAAGTAAAAQPATAPAPSGK